MPSKVEFTTASLKKAMGLVQHVAVKSHIPILAMIRVRLGSLMAQGPHIQVCAPVDGTGDPIDICLHPGRLASAIELGGEKITFIVEHEKCVIKTGKHRFQINGIVGAEYPEMMPGRVDDSIKTTPEFHESLERLAPFAAVGDVRYWMNGIFAESNGKEFSLVAMTGGQMAWKTMSIPASNFGFILPTDAALLMAKCEAGEFSWSPTTAFFTNENVSVIIKRIDGKYAEWRRAMFIPNSQVSVSRKELQQTVGLSRITGSQKNRPVRLVSKEKILSVECIGNGESISAKIDIIGSQGVDIEAAFDGRLLALLLQAIGDKECVIEWDKKLKDASMLMRSQDGFSCVLAQLRV